MTQQIAHIAYRIKSHISKQGTAYRDHYSVFTDSIRLKLIMEFFGLNIDLDVIVESDPDLFFTDARKFVCCKRPAIEKLRLLQ